MNTAWSARTFTSAEIIFFVVPSVEKYLQLLKSKYWVRGVARELFKLENWHDWKLIKFEDKKNDYFMDQIELLNAVIIIST